MEPINYLGMMQPINLGQNFAQGFGIGANIRAMQQQREAEQQKLQQTQMLREKLQAHFANPSYQSASELMAIAPEYAKEFQSSFEVLDKGRKEQEFNTGIKAFNAIKTGNVDIAESLIDEQISATENSGQDASFLKRMKDSLKINPMSTAASLSMVLSGIDPDRWNKIAKEQRDVAEEEREAQLFGSELAIKQGEAAQVPFKLKEAESNASKAAIAANFAESQAVMDLEKKGWDIKKLQADMDIARQNVAIAAMNARTASAGNSLKAQENQLKLQDLIQKRDDALRAKTAEIESSRLNMDNMLNTANRILKTPKNVIEAATGPISSRLPTASQDTADFEELVNVLGSQAFLAQIPLIKGMGALSNAEGDKLQASLQNFNLRQSDKRLIANVKEAVRLVTKARKNLADKYGVPDTAPDTPASIPAMPAGAVKRIK